MSPNLRAFLAMIAHAEGTAGIGDDGYNVLVGSTPKRPRLFHDYSDHPRVSVRVRDGLHSTAAGRYQILARYYDAYKAHLRLPDFSPASQDRIATQLLKETRALPAIEAGRIAEAIARSKSRWASLPGAGYGQREHKLEHLLAAYAQAGGTVTTSNA